MKTLEEIKQQLEQLDRVYERMSRRTVSAHSTQGWHKGYMVYAFGANWLHHEGKWYPIDEAREPLDEYKDNLQTRSD